ncbi:hypothetical protein M1M25_gp039 [Tenacibaculum phage Gundel_1]|uniref:Uncharacterized protein n=1 Tax=Tenacibaculum phage Gundel_1 TaxID=2745672 RepID=A0A8E4ZL29_9CAUD|nr:hypothetical protein M1M25_gp039 [Tenacibaculum phage Gundel_1]QQV91471.1 hypothetical protein Gundel1_39 [Tenacibaculum phage Gundel_1]
MRFHGQYCVVCEQQTMFIEKLKDPKDGFCEEIVDVCLECNNKFSAKPEKKKIKITFKTIK